jgi:TRAP transporter TAXI family solute receptor
MLQFFLPHLALFHLLRGFTRMIEKRSRFSLAAATVLLCALVLGGWLGGCGGGDGSNGTDEGGSGKPKYLNMGTSKFGTFQQIGNSLCEVLNKNVGENNWKAQGKGTSGSQENIRLVDKGENELGLSNSAISYHAINGTGGWEKKYKIRTVVTIAPLVAMFVTKSDSGIKTMKDLKGKRVICGPNGAGFDMFIEPLLTAHGLKFSDFDKLNANFGDSVTQLGDGGADAAFLGGASPSPNIRLASDLGILLIPFEEEARKELVKDYPFFSEITVKAGTYPDLKKDYLGLNVGTMHLITSAAQDDEFVYQITRTLWENRAKISHPAAKKFINEENAARFTGTEFHPGAIRFYKEIGIWPEAADTDQQNNETPGTDDQSGNADESQ